MTLPRPLRGEEWILITAALSGIPHLIRAPWLVSLAAIAVIIYFLLQRKKIFPQPNKLFRVFSAFSALAIIIWSHRTLLGLESGISFLLLITALKLFELKAKRDFALLIWLSSLLMIGELIFNQNIAATIFCFLGLGLSLHCLLMLSTMESLAAPAPRFGFGMKRVAIYSFPIILIMFFVFPRIQLNLLGAFTPGVSAEIGFDDELRPGDVAKLSASDKVAFRATFRDNNPPPARDLYWRGAVLTVSDGLNWLKPRRNFLPTRNVETNGSIVQEIIIESQPTKWLFGLDRPMSVVMAGEGSPLPLRTKENTFESTQKIADRTAYRVYSNPSAAQEELDPDTAKRTMRLPKSLDRRIAALGQEIRKAGGDQNEISERALDFFRQGKFEYTLQPGQQNVGSIAHFMFESKKGFCEHFASAYALLLRAAGINSRVVVGFQGGTFNTYGGYYVVSFREAHAWVEAWIPNLGWVRKDPTAVVAPQRIGMTTENIIGSQLGEGLFDKISKKALQGDFLGVFAETVFFIDSINSKWNYYLISYDLDFQRGLLERWSFKHPVWKVALLVFSSAFFLILAILGLAYWRLRPRVDPVLRSYAKMQKILAKKGVRKTLGEGPLDFARRARTALPEEGEAIDQAVLLFIDLRYGRKKLESSKLAELEENIKKIA